MAKLDASQIERCHQKVKAFLGDAPIGLPPTLAQLLEKFKSPEPLTMEFPGGTVPPSPPCDFVAPTDIANAVPTVE